MDRLALVALTSALLLCAQFVPDSSTRLSYSLPAFSRTGERKLEARSVYLDTFGKTGQPIKRELVVVFDRASGYFMFTYVGFGNFKEAAERDKGPVASQAERTTARYAVYVSESGILLVSAGKPTLTVGQSSEKVASIDDAERRAVRAVTEKAVDAARAPFWPTGTLVQLANREGMALLPADFYIPPGSVVAKPVSVVAIAESAEGWEITLQGQYKARVILSPTFEPLKAERIDPPKP